ENGRARAGVARVADPVSVRILLLFIRFVRAAVIAVRNAVAIALGARRTRQPTALDAVGETVDHVRRVAVDTGKEAGVVVARSAPVVPLAFERELHGRIGEGPRPRTPREVVAKDRVLASTEKEDGYVGEFSGVL